MDPARKMPQRVTLDTGCSASPELLKTIERTGAEIIISTVSVHELGDSSWAAAYDGLERKPGPGGWGLNWGECFGGGVAVEFADHTGAQAHASPFCEILWVISSGAVRLPSDWGSLTPNQRRMINDAMIFSVHVQQRGDVFVTADRRAFVNAGKREKLEAMFRTRILTPEEVMAEFGDSGRFLEPPK